jgi:hypothetical protein
MKNKAHSSFYLFLFIVISFNYGNEVFGQEKVNLSIGVGSPELYNIGVRYQLEQAQIGISYGIIPGYYNGRVFSISGDLYIHFGGNSKFSERHPWYFRIGISYLRDETSYTIHKYTYLPIRVGRDINFSKKIGMAIDLGVVIELNDKEIQKQPTSSFWSFLENDTSILPGLGITLFYRL